MSGIKDKISHTIKDNSRSGIVKRNIPAIVALKGLSLLCNLAIVPLTIHYVDVDTYGIWLTLSSVVAWISFLDIGLNNSLRNKFAECVADGNHELARHYVSSTYFMLIAIFGSVFILFAVLNPFVDWCSIFKLSSVDNRQISDAMLILVAYFCLRFVLSTINVILLADQKSAQASLRGFLEQLVSLAALWMLTMTTSGTLRLLCVGLCAAPILVLLTFNFTLFAGKYYRYRPSLKFVEFGYVKQLFTVGIKFFVIQLSGIIQYQMINFIIIRNYGSVDVAAYNIVHKYFNIGYLAFTTILIPVWSAVTDASAKGEYMWIRNLIAKYRKVFYLASLAMIVMGGISPVVYPLWLGADTIQIPFALTVVVMLACLSMMYGAVYVQVLSGLGILNIQMFCSCIAPFLFLILCYLFTHVWHLGLCWIVVASIASNFNGFIVAPIQCRYEIAKHLKASRE